jgi:hypothetical protein
MLFGSAVEKERPLSRALCLPLRGLYPLLILALIVQDEADHQAASAHAYPVVKAAQSRQANYLRGLPRGPGRSCPGCTSLFFYLTRRATEAEPLPYHGLTAEAPG